MQIYKHKIRKNTGLKKEKNIKKYLQFKKKYDIINR